MSSKGQVARAQPIDNRFADETPQQIAQHREIDRRHRRRHSDAPLIARLRISELERIFVMHYRDKRLPDDDAGRADLRLMADHLAQIDPRLIRPWAARWMPTITAPELNALIIAVGTGRRWKADALARELGLDDTTRTKLRIKTIGAFDCTKAKRKSRRSRKRRAADRARRAKAGAKSHAQSAAATQPWLDEGISRSTYYRRRAPQKSGVETVETNSRPIDRRSSIKKHSSGGVTDCTTDPRREHAAEASSFTAKPLPSASFRVDPPSAHPTPDQIAGLENVSAVVISFREAHWERNQLVEAVQLDPKQKARLGELDAFIETERSRLEERRFSLSVKPAADDICIPPPRNPSGAERLGRLQK